MTALKIGVSACFFHADPKRAIFKGKTLLYCEQSIMSWIASQGVYVYLIPSTQPSDSQKESQHLSLSDYADDLDGLVLQGGSDLSPTSYGETPLKPEWTGDAIRDAYEIELLKLFQFRKKPVLGICRGAQLINVALGGTLYQDIPTQVPGAINHRDWDIYDQNFHSIKIEKNSFLSQIYSGVEKSKVNSIHHQGIKRLGKGLVAEAYSEEDKMIEAVRYNGDSFILGVQWHPEFQDGVDSSLLSAKPIMKAFLVEAKMRK